MKIILSSLLFSFATLVIAAQERISTDRPDQTEDANVTPKGYFQAEFGLGAANLNFYSFLITHPDALFKYGISKRFDVQFLATYMSLYEKTNPSTRMGRGFSTCMIGVRAGLWEQKKIIPKTSLIIRAGPPAFASKAFRPRYAEGLVLLAMANEITDRLEIGYNIAALWLGDAKKPAPFFSITSQFDLAARWDAFLEFFMQGKIVTASGWFPGEQSADAGLGFYITNDMKLDGYFGLGLSMDAPKNFFGVGFSFRVH